VNVSWRLYAKKNKNSPGTHRTKPRLALEMLVVAAAWLPGRQLIVVADIAYMGRHLL
jgi:hypothetical protein